MSQPEESEAQKGNASDENQYEVDLDTQETGQTRQINGYDTREVVMTITTRKKGKTLDEGGGMVMTTHLWLTKTLSGMDEIQDFNRRYAEKISSPFVGSSPEQFAVLSGMYPAMQQAMAKYQSEEVDMSGTPVLTSMTIENVAGKEQMESQNQQEEESPKSLGGLFGGLGKKFGKKKSEDQEDQKPGRSTVMTMTNELLSASTNRQIEGETVVTAITAGAADTRSGLVSRIVAVVPWGKSRCTKHLRRKRGCFNPRPGRTMFRHSDWSWGFCLWRSWPSSSSFSSENGRGDMCGPGRASRSLVIWLCWTPAFMPK
ncbi:MAG: hypothetical protein P8Y94_01380 [Acidobacteriota bacterium]